MRAAYIQNKNAAMCCAYMIDQADQTARAHEEECVGVMAGLNMTKSVALPS